MKHMIQRIIQHVYFLVRINMLKRKRNFEKLMVRNREKQTFWSNGIIDVFLFSSMSTGIRRRRRYDWRWNLTWNCEYSVNSLQHYFFLLTISSFSWSFVWKENFFFSNNRKRIFSEILPTGRYHLIIDRFL